MGDADENKEKPTDNKSSPLRQVCVEDLEEELDRILDAATAGHQRIITHDGVPIVRFVPVESEKK